MAVRKTRIFIVAGEASGDVLGGKLLDALYYMAADSIEVQGIGGEHMEAQGLNSLFPMRDIALMGFAEIIPHTWRLLCRLKEACEAAVNFQPDIVITIDSPGFNFRLVKWVRQCFGKKVTCIHYVAPTVWAYKPQRAAKTAELYDHLLTLLPFEPRYFEAHGLTSTFIGHPVVDDLGVDYHPPRIFGSEGGQPLNLCVFLGSRKGEVQTLTPVFKQTAALLAERFPALRIIIPTNEMALPYISKTGWPVEPEIVVGEAARSVAMHQSHVALTKTGTVTLEIAKHGLPMVATYRIHAISAAILRRIMHLPYVNLINIIGGKEIIPEYMQEACKPELLAEAVTTLVNSPKAANSQSEEAMLSLHKMRNRHHVLASDRAAEIVMSYRPEQ